MADRWRNAYYALAAACMTVSTLLRWIRHQRATTAIETTLTEQRRKLGSALNRRTINLLHTSLLSIRALHLYGSEDERLTKELDLIFAKPEFVHSIRAYHAVLVDFEWHNRRLRAIEFTRSISLIVGLACLVAFIFPWIATIFTQAAEFTTLSWILLVFAIESAVAFAILSALCRMYRSRKQSIVENGTEQD